jgi:hypothetical protein
MKALGAMFIAILCFGSGGNSEAKDTFCNFVQSFFFATRTKGNP